MLLRWHTHSNDITAQTFQKPNWRLAAPHSWKQTLRGNQNFKKKILQKKLEFKRLYLAAHFERVNFLSLLAQSLVHAAQMVAHHAKLVFVAPLSRSQLILRVRPKQLQSECFLTWKDANVYALCYNWKLFGSASYLQACDILISQFDLLTESLPRLLCNG